MKELHGSNQSEGTILAAPRRTFVGVFHERLLANTGLASVLCEFDLDTIRMALETKHFWLPSQSAASPTFGGLVDNDIECGDEESRLVAKHSGRQLDDDEGFDETADGDEDLGEEGAGNQADSHSSSSGSAATTTTTAASEAYAFLAEHTLLRGELRGQCKLIVPHRVTALAFETLAKRQKTPKSANRASRSSSSNFSSPRGPSTTRLQSAVIHLGTSRGALIRVLRRPRRGAAEMHLPSSNSRADASSLGSSSETG